MEFHVYYKAAPHGQLRLVTAEHETAGEAIADVAGMLKDEGEVAHGPILAMMIGGKSN